MYNTAPNGNNITYPILPSMLDTTHNKAYINIIINFGTFLFILENNVFKKPDFKAIPKAMAAIKSEPKGTKLIKLS